MKRLLYISCYYPPTATMGAYRAQRMVRDLRGHGWESLVVAGRTTADMSSDGRLEDYSLACIHVDFVDPYLPIHKLRSFFAAHTKNSDAPVSAAGKINDFSWRALILRYLKQAPRQFWFVSMNRMPDRFLPFVPGAISAALKLVEKHGADAVLASIGPASDAIVGAIVAKRLGLPLVIDYRDHWSLNPADPRWPLVHQLDQSIEKLVVRHADRFTTVSRPIAEELEALHGIKTAVLPNSYDGGRSLAPWRFSDGGPLILHTGMLYNGRRNPQAFLEGLAEFRRRHGCGQALFIGSDARAVVESRATRLGLGDSVKCMAAMRHDEALAWQEKADVLLMVEEISPAVRGVMTGKIFEYIGAQRPILAMIPADSAVNDLLTHTRCGATAQSASQVTDFLEKLLEKKESFYNPDKAAVASYSGEAVAGRLARLLEELCAGKH